MLCSSIVRYERLRRKHDSVREILPPLAEQHSIKTREFEDMKNDARKQGRLLQELKQDVDVFIRFVFFLYITFLSNTFVLYLFFYIICAHTANI